VTNNRTLGEPRSERTDEQLIMADKITGNNKTGSGVPKKNITYYVPSGLPRPPNYRGSPDDRRRSPLYVCMFSAAFVCFRPNTP